jgi:hypothetical protein
VALSDDREEHGSLTGAASHASRSSRPNFFSSAASDLESWRLAKTSVQHCGRGCAFPAASAFSTQRIPIEETGMHQTLWRAAALSALLSLPLCAVAVAQSSGGGGGASGSAGGAAGGSARGGSSVGGGATGTGSALGTGRSIGPGSTLGTGSSIDGSRSTLGTDSTLGTRSPSSLGSTTDPLRTDPTGPIGTQRMSDPNAVREDSLRPGAAGPTGSLGSGSSSLGSGSSGGAAIGRGTSTPGTASGSPPGASPLDPGGSMGTPGATFGGRGR